MQNTKDTLCKIQKIHDAKYKRYIMQNTKDTLCKIQKIHMQNTKDT